MTGTSPVMPAPPDEQLAELVFAHRDVTGAVLAALDGRVLAADVPDSSDGRQIAAMLASTFGLGQRLVSLLGDADLGEISVRSDDGLITVYAVGRRAALLILSRPGVNLGLLQRSSRRVVTTLEAAIHPEGSLR